MHSQAVPEPAERDAVVPGALVDDLVGELTRVELEALDEAVTALLVAKHVLVASRPRAIDVGEEEAGEADGHLRSELEAYGPASRRPLTLLTRSAWVGAMFPAWAQRYLAEMRAHYRPHRAYLERHDRGHIVMRLVFDDGRTPEHRHVYTVTSDGIVRRFGYALFPEEKRIKLTRTDHVSPRLLATFERDAWVRLEHLPELVADCRRHEDLRAFAGVVQAAARWPDLLGIACWGPATLTSPWESPTRAVNIFDGRALVEPYAQR